MVKFAGIEFSEADIQAVAEKMRLEREEKTKKRSEFIKTSLFSKIINTIIEKDIFLDEESFRYFPEENLAKFSLPELTKNDLNLFIDCMTDDNLITPQNSFIEEDNDFDNTTTEKLGLKVFMMWGQGCCIQIFPSSMTR